MAADEDESWDDEETEIVPPNADGSVNVSQISLIGAIAEHLTKMHGSIPMVSRQMNALVEAANLIVDEFKQPVVMASVGMGMFDWLQSDDVGASSKYMAFELALREHQAPNNHPHDPDDFGRCVRMLDAIPEHRERLHLMEQPKHGPVWNALAKDWSRLESVYRRDYESGQSAALYAEIRKIIEAARR